MEIYEEITEKISQFIAEQHVFFVATAAAETQINLSPKGLDTFRIIDRHTIAYLDYVGSGNETAAHLLADGRITVMFCAFQGAANIVRLYGTGEPVLPGDEGFDDLLALFPPQEKLRQIMRIRVDEAQTSCGYGVPLMTYDRDRETLVKWTAGKSDDEYADYQRQNNLTSKQGLPTGLADRLGGADDA